MAAALKEPSHRHAIAHLQGLNTLADLDDTTDALVSQNTTRHLTEITGSHVQVSVAHARVFNLHERLAVTDSRNGNLANLNRTVNLLRDNNSLHGFLAHDLNSLVIGSRTQAASYNLQSALCNLAGWARIFFTSHFHHNMMSRQSKEPSPNMTEGLVRIILTSKGDLSIRSIPTNALNCQMLIYDAMTKQHRR